MNTKKNIPFDKTRFGLNVSVARKEKGYSQEDLSKRIGVSRQAISQWETGYTVPSIDNIVRITQLTGWTFKELTRDCLK